MLIIMINNLSTSELSPPYRALQWGQFIDYWSVHCLIIQTFGDDFQVVCFKQWHKQLNYDLYVVSIADEVYCLVAKSCGSLRNDCILFTQTFKTFSKPLFYLPRSRIFWIAKDKEGLSLPSIYKILFWTLV